MELAKYVSKNDALIMLEIANASLLCKTEKGYRKLIARLNELIFFDHSISALIDMHNISCENMNACSINSGYPVEYLETYTNRKYQLIDPLYKSFLKTYDVQNIHELKNQNNDISINSVVRLCNDFGITNSYLYGIFSSNNTTFTVFTISGKQIKNKQRTKAIIKYLMPFLSRALKTLVPVSAAQDVPIITSSELEILKWLKEGKSSWEISNILGKSERVINFHTGNIINKLNANNRTHAVAIALEHNLIEI
jgi:LuxR family transcriptional regulator, quorum-sensing system regulator CviR